MNKNETLQLDSLPKDGRIEKYGRRFSSEVHSVEDTFAFSKGLFDDCLQFLKINLNVNFPNLELNLLNHKTYTDLWNRLHLCNGALPQTKGFVCGNGYYAQIYIDLEIYAKGTPTEFVANLSILFLEELFHSVDIHKSENEISASLCKAIEDFLEIKLPDSAKEYRLEYAERIDKINP
jgi:hypothetical protein